MTNPNAASYRIIESAIEVHRHLGAGLLESAYRACLAYEFLDRGIDFQQELALPVNYKGRRVNCGFRVDFIVGGTVVVEAKAVEAISPVHMAQILVTPFPDPNVRNLKNAAAVAEGVVCGDPFGEGVF